MSSAKGNVVIRIHANENRFLISMYVIITLLPLITIYLVCWNYILWPIVDNDITVIIRYI